MDKAILGAKVTVMPFSGLDDVPQKGVVVGFSYKHPGSAPRGGISAVAVTIPYLDLMGHNAFTTMWFKAEDVTVDGFDAMAVSDHLNNIDKHLTDAKAALLTNTMPTKAYLSLREYVTDKINQAMTIVEGLRKT